MFASGNGETKKETLFDTDTDTDFARGSLAKIIKDNAVFCRILCVVLYVSE